ncbi:hypothetical protein CISG_10422, partial [Coccidioides immitis RMSCC 3703]
MEVRACCRTFDRKVDREEGTRGRADRTLRRVEPTRAMRSDLDSSPPDDGSQRRQTRADGGTDDCRDDRNEQFRHAGDGTQPWTILGRIRRFGSAEASPASPSWQGRRTTRPTRGRPRPANPTR